MADNHLMFSEVLELKDGAERVWMRRQLMPVVVCGCWDDRWSENSDWQVFDEYNVPDALKDTVIAKCSRFLVDCPDLDEIVADDEEDGFYLEWGQDDHHVVFYTEDSGRVDRLARLVQQFLQRFHPQDSWSITWSTSCSKMRPGEFGGGGLLVTATEMFWEDGHNHVEVARNRFEKLGHHGHWGSHDRFPVTDWAHEVAKDSTRRGYWDWVLRQIESNEEETKEKA